jgi:hypothetical protein
LQNKPHTHTHFNAKEKACNRHRGFCWIYTDQCWKFIKNCYWYPYDKNLVLNKYHRNY